MTTSRLDSAGVGAPSPLEPPHTGSGTSYGTPAHKVRYKALTWLWGDGATLVLQVPFGIREYLSGRAELAGPVIEPYALREGDQPD